MADTSQRFLRTIYKTKNLKTSLQALYNSDLPPDQLQDIIDKSSAHLPDLQGLKVDFSKYKKTKSTQLHTRPLKDKHIESMKTDAQVKANVGAYKRKLMGLEDVIGGAVSVGRAILGAEDGDDDVQELPRPAEAAAQGEPRPKKKAKTRPVGPTMGETLLETTGIPAAVRLASKIGEFRENMNHPPMRVIRGKDEEEKEGEYPGGSLGPGDGSIPLGPEDGSNPEPNPEQYGSIPYQEPGVGITPITFDESLNPEFVKAYNAVKDRVDLLGFDHPVAVGGMRGFHNDYYKGKKVFRSQFPDPKVLLDAFNGIVKEENERHASAPTPRRDSPYVSPYDQPPSAGDSSLNAASGTEKVVVPPSESNIEIPNDALTANGAPGPVSEDQPMNVAGASSVLGRSVVSQVLQRSGVLGPLAGQYAGHALSPEDPVEVARAAATLASATGSAAIAAGSAFVDTMSSMYNTASAALFGPGAAVGGISQQAGLLAEAALSDPRDDYKFGMLPPRMASAPALAAPNGLGNVMAFEDAPLTSRISPLVEKILVPPSTRPIPASQPEGGRLAMQAFQNYQQDIEAPYAVRR